MELPQGASDSVSSERNRWLIFLFFFFIRKETENLTEEGGAGSKVKEKKEEKIGVWRLSFGGGGGQDE